MKTSKKTVIGLVVLGVTLLLNLDHVMNNYGYGSNYFRSQIFASGSSGSSSSSSSSSNTGTDTSSRVRLWYYRPVDCTDTWTGKASIGGCVVMFGKEKCNFGMWANVEYKYKGRKENCTGGDYWYDCEGAQKECVPSGTDF